MWVCCLWSELAWNGELDCGSGIVMDSTTLYSRIRDIYTTRGTRGVDADRRVEQACNIAVVPSTPSSMVVPSVKIQPYRHGPA